MTKKKNGFLTFCFSLMPGAGEMYMGFMKQGLSIMAIFWGIIFFAAYFGMDYFIFLLPIVWFYSFFKVHNLRGMPDEEFYALEDEYLIHLDKILPPDKWSKKQNTILAGVLIITGGIMLWKNLVGFFRDFIPNAIYWRLVGDVPQLVMALILITIGVMLIRGKKAQLDKEEEGEQ